jgi:lipoprotein-releasing system ATP-binding protein
MSHSPSHTRLPAGPLRVSAAGLGKIYLQEAQPVEVLRGLELAVAAGEKLAVTGESGVGKSTLLHLLGALDTPTSGSVAIQDQPVSSWNGEQRARLRGRHLGFVFQFHHLLAEFSVRENVLMPAVIAGRETAESGRRADQLLERLGLTARAAHRPAQLSGGEQQRAAIARALLMGPGLVLADEPTGNLDPRIGGEVFDLLLELAEERTFTLVVVTHNGELAKRCDRTLRLTRDGFVL